MNYKAFISDKYTNPSFSSGGSTFRDVHWLNFGLGEEVNPVTSFGCAALTQMRSLGKR